LAQKLLINVGEIHTWWQKLAAYLSSWPTQNLQIFYPLSGINTDNNPACKVTTARNTDFEQEKKFTLKL